MLEWLSNLGQKPDHPMHSVEEADRLLSGLPWEDAPKALEEITSWLTTLTSASGFSLGTRIEVLEMVDETGQPFEPDINRAYLTGTVSEFERQRLWDTSLQFWRRLTQAYGFCIKEVRRDPKLQRTHRNHLQVLIARTLRAMAAQVKVLRLRYMTADESLWQAMFELYALSEELECDHQRVQAYATDAVQTTPRYELLRALLLDIASPESMLPWQTEITTRVAARFCDACLFKRTPETGCNWYIDLAHPRPPEHTTGVATLQQSARFFGAGAVIAKMEEMIRRLTLEPNAIEQRFGKEYTPQQKLMVLQRLVSFWGEQQRRRREPRRRLEGDISAVHGYTQTCQLVPRADFHGWSEFVVNMDKKFKERLGYDPAAPTPGIAAEKWVAQDASSRSIGVLVARTSEPWVMLGALCALRIGDAQWSVSVVRSLSRDTGGRVQAGVELLAKKPVTQWLRRAGKGGSSVEQRASADASIHDYLNAIGDGDQSAQDGTCEVLIARGNFIAGAVYAPMSDEARSHLQFEALLEQGADFDRVRCRLVAAT
jgi:hypothetical protein